MMTYLLKDGYVELAPVGTNFISYMPGSQPVVVRAMPPLGGVVPEVDHWRLTAAGVEFVQAWIGDQVIDEPLNDSQDMTS